MCFFELWGGLWNAGSTDNSCSTQPVDSIPRICRFSFFFLLTFVCFALSSLQTIGRHSIDLRDSLFRTVPPNSMSTLMEIAQSVYPCAVFNKRSLSFHAVSPKAASLWRSDCDASHERCDKGFARGFDQPRSATPPFPICHPEAVGLVGDLHDLKHIRLILECRMWFCVLDSVSYVLTMQFARSVWYAYNSVLTGSHHISLIIVNISFKTLLRCSKWCWC